PPLRRPALTGEGRGSAAPTSLARVVDVGRQRRVSVVRRFVVTGAGDPASVLARLADRAGLRVSSSVVVERTFLDTADGRLDAAGVVLELRRAVEGGASPTLVWTEDGRTVATAALPAPVAPRFAADLPDWPPARRLADLMEMCALVPAAAVRP